MAASRATSYAPSERVPHRHEVSAPGIPRSVRRPSVAKRTDGRAGYARDARGVSLIELLVSLVVSAILLGVAAPSFSEIVADQRQTALYNALARDLRYARSEAIKRGTTVRVCARGDDTSCGDGWHDGWHVATSQGGVDELLRSHRIGDADAHRLFASAVVHPDALAEVESIAFGSRGRADWTLGTLRICDHRGADQARALIVNGAGGLRQAAATSGSPNVVVDAVGEPLTCASRP